MSKPHDQIARVLREALPEISLQLHTGSFSQAAMDLAAYNLTARLVTAGVTIGPCPECAKREEECRMQEYLDDMERAGDV